MRLTDKEIEKIIDSVKTEPMTVQEISRLIKKSWVTTDKYLQYIKEKTGLINIKTFRKGTQAALKIVYYVEKTNPSTDKIKEALYNKISNSNFESEFDFMEVFQFIPDEKKKAYHETYNKKSLLKDKRVIELTGSAAAHLYILSGNMSYLRVYDRGVPLLNVMEKLLQRGVFIKIITRINVSSLSNINQIKHLLVKYPSLIEIRHRYQPLRGFIIDGKIARFKTDETVSNYKKGELAENTRIFFEIYDKDWLNWLERVFYSMYNSSISYEARIKEINNIFR